MKTSIQIPNTLANLSKDALGEANGCYHKFFNTACKKVSPSYTKILIK